MSENFAASEDEESKRGTNKGTFKEEGDEQNDLMVNDGGFDMMIGNPAQDS